MSLIDTIIDAFTGQRLSTMLAMQQVELARLERMAKRPKDNRLISRIAIADQQAQVGPDRVAAGYCNADRSGVAIFVQRGERFGQMLLHTDEARELLAQLQDTLKQ